MIKDECSLHKTMTIQVDINKKITQAISTNKGVNKSTTFVYFNIYIDDALRKWKITFKGPINLLILS